MSYNEPFISVAMGVLYRSDDITLLKRSVDSVLAQTFDKFEFLIADDGSSKRSQQYLEQMAQQDKRIRLLRGYSAYSLSKKLNLCLREAKGEFVARMDDDDYAYPERFALQLSYLQSHPETVFVGCQIRLVRNGETVGERSLPLNPKVRDFYMTQPYIHPALIFCREALEQVGGYCEKPCVYKCEDYDLLLRLYTAGQRGSNLPEVLLDYTVRENAHDGRKYRDRWHETQTRYLRFRQLGVLPQALLWVVKPLVTGLLPERLLRYIKAVRTRVSM